jgi:hypothetical protein
MAKRVIPVQFVDPATGQLTFDAVRYLNDLDNGASDSIRSVGTILSGVNQTQQAILDGTQPLADVIISGTGSVSGQLSSVSENVAVAATAAASGGALSASVLPTYAYSLIVGAGTATTNTVTVTASGGTGPYTYAWTKKSGLGTITADFPTAASTEFSGVLSSGFARSQIWTCTVTDSAAASVAVDVSVYIESDSGL